MKTTILTALALTTAMAGSASAHATLDQRSATLGETTKISLRVPHGCEGEATHTVRLTIPEGFYNVKPMPKAGWELSTTTGAYATPYMNHGTKMTEGVREVTWSGGHLEDGWYDEFTVRGSFANAETGSTLYFPAVQECANGVADWTDTSGGEVANPAPKLQLVAGDAMAHDHAGHGAHAGHAMEAEAGPVTLGALTLSDGFSRATLPNAPVGGGFLTITNNGDSADRLIAVETAVAGHSEIHEMAMEGDVMRMRELEDGLEIPAGETIELKPGGFHLMFMKLQQPLVEGETVDVTLTFETAGTVTLPLAIGAPNAKTHGHGDHEHMDH
ncbi:hypothetical protein SAMN06297129_1812 [Pseudooceanicola antarcticus]|uniref:YncI copper-binding domain-containing protein n=1 Tax=Pseudooceanicola antarcticus TaxID=1247613 RepID=A0A285IQX2_9RHOB|nr:DUF1775 domain-containing protein [Pseudooceanicola antarcticus]PJE31786.1 hypothetical protein CVM39_01390 [Pseudooceanicola antarcticus]SNY50388.1 hypothetical protein SAMN06297129_1812 [Pseudooceanicola antarcticus]